MDRKKNAFMDTVTPDDSRLFRESVGSVTPVEHDRAGTVARKPRPAAYPEQSRNDADDVLRQLRDKPFAVAPVETGDELSYLRPGVRKQSLRKLKRGQIAIQAEFDLHGMFVDEARTAVRNFIARCIGQGKYAVRIIHGKGLGSRNKHPVLKNKLNKWLQQNSAVLAYCSARPVDGGTGAVYVLLKRSGQ